MATTEFMKLFTGSYIVGKLVRELIVRVLVMRHFLVEESVCLWLECLYCSDATLSATDPCCWRVGKSLLIN